MENIVFTHQAIDYDDFIDKIKQISSENSPRFISSFITGDFFKLDTGSVMHYFWFYEFMSNADKMNFIHEALKILVSNNTDDETALS